MKQVVMFVRLHLEVPEHVDPDTLYIELDKYRVYTDSGEEVEAELSSHVTEECLEDE